MSGLLNSALINALRKRLESIVDFELNYGRDAVRHFAETVAPYHGVLDIGAGPGTDLFACKEAYTHCELHALECDRPNVELLRSQRVCVQQLDIEREEFPYEPCSMELVIANQVLEHVKDIFWVLHNVARVTAVGGHFIVGVPNLASLHNRVLLMLGLQPTCINSFSAHVRGYTKHDLLRLLINCWPGGFRLIERRGGNFYPFPPSVARPLARALPSLAWGMFLLLRKEGEYSGEFIRAAKAQGFETNFYFGPHDAT